MDVFIDTFPTTRTYTKNDLSPGKTGFLPVSIEIDGPNFLTYYSDELGNLYEQPITHNGKYKIVPYESNPSGDPDQGFPIAGFLPKYLANQASGDYDLNIQIPNSGGDPQPPEITPNTCYFKIDNEVVEYINNYGQPGDEDRGTLRLPSTDTGLMQKVEFDIGDKNYATEVAIDLSDITFPEPTITPNGAVLDITPAVLEFVNNNPQWENVGRVILPNAFLTALTDYTLEDESKGYATNLTINVGSLAGFFNLDANTRNISQNGTYQIGNFDNNAEDIEIERQNNRGMSIRLIEDGEEDGTKGDTKDDPTPTPNPNANYTMGTFTVNVQPRLEDKTITVTTTDGTQTITHGSGYDGLGTVTINSNVSIPKTFVKYIAWGEGLDSTTNYYNINGSYFDINELFHNQIQGVTLYKTRPPTESEERPPDVKINNPNPGHIFGYIAIQRVNLGFNYGLDTENNYPTTIYNPGFIIYFNRYMSNEDSAYFGLRYWDSQIDKDNAKTIIAVFDTDTMNSNINDPVNLTGILFNENQQIVNIMPSIPFDYSRNFVWTYLPSSIYSFSNNNENSFDFDEIYNSITNPVEQ